MRLPTLTLCVTLGFAAAAHADNTADEADVAFVLGNEAYAKSDYQRALSQYFLSYRLVPNRNVLFNMVRCYEALDRFNEAYRYFNSTKMTCVGVSPMFSPVWLWASSQRTSPCSRLRSLL